MEPACQIFGNDTTCQIFVYSPGERDGLQVAYLTENQTWQNVGRLCNSDYAQWGSEKKMYDPYVVHANDGTWRLVFAVNDYSPCFAAAYSEDLVTWRPQDYPRMAEKGVSEPIKPKTEPIAMFKAARISGVSRNLPIPVLSMRLLGCVIRQL